MKIGTIIHHCFLIVKLYFVEGMQFYFKALFEALVFLLIIVNRLIRFVCRMSFFIRDTYVVC